MSGGAVRISLAQQIEGAGAALSAQQMLVDSGRAKLAADARYQLERLRAGHATLKALLPVADILRAVLRLDAARRASLTALLERWLAEQDTEQAGQEDAQEDGAVAGDGGTA